VGFHLWIDGEHAWAQGTYEYRPMGVAIIAASDLFYPRDFARIRRAPSIFEACYVGQFASIGQLNQRLRRFREATLR